jgi:N-acetylglucosamine-6-phosphate deacetylase
MDRAVRNAMKWLDVDLCQAVRMASANPVRVLGRENRIGRIQEGLDADLVLLDRELKVLRTWVGGQCVYRREA